MTCWKPLRLSHRDGPVKPAHDGGGEGANISAVIGGLDPPIPIGEVRRLLLGAGSSPAQDGGVSSRVFPWP